MFISTGGIVLPTDGSSVNLTQAAFGSDLTRLGEYVIHIQNTGSVPVFIGPQPVSNSSGIVLAPGKDFRVTLDGDSISVSQGSATTGVITALVWTS